MHSRTSDMDPTSRYLSLAVNTTFAAKAAVQDLATLVWGACEWAESSRGILGASVVCLAAQNTYEVVDRPNKVGLTDRL